MMVLFSCRTAVAALAALLLAGCGSDGPDTGEVTGTVTLDGKPLEGAVLLFTPTEGGRQSGGKTDAEGRYELIYSRDQTGALPGEHKVQITTHVDANTDDGTPAVPELLPAKYNTDTELTKTVEPGDNVIDFELDSEGEIVSEYE